MMHDPFAITEEGSGADLDDPRLIAVSQDYLRALESGVRPDRERYLARCPEIRELASECLDGIELAFSMGKGQRYVFRDSTRQADQSLLEPLGDFRLVREIGRGGMGIVYEASQLSLARSVALKVLPFAAALDERHRKRFLLEAQSAAQLHHPNIVPVYAVGCERGTHFYAMQLINGRPISASLFDDLVSSVDGIPFDSNGSTVAFRSENTSRELSSRTGSSTRTRLRDRNRIIASLIAQVADALDYAHSCGIVHRDVKPGNLLLDANGKIWITDFGLAQIATSEHMTQTGDLLGTLRYMSPEQASGHPGVIDHRSDVYSLGATLYEMLTRKPVFEGSGRQELLHLILNEEPRRLRKIDRSIPEELEIITLKALRQSPIDRYDSSRDFADDLRRFLSETPVLARRPTFVDNTRKWMRRHPSTVLSILFALVAAVLSLAVVTATVTHQKSLTFDSLQREQQRAQQAERRLAVAQSAADEMIRLAENELSFSPMEEALKPRLLASGIRYYQSLIEETNGDSAIQSSLMAIRDRAEKNLAILQLVQADRQLRHLMDPAVQRELGLTAQQCEAINSRNVTVVQPDNPWSLEQARQRQLLADELLTVEQRQRLAQIALQLQGPPGMATVVGQLDLSSEQIQDIQKDIVGFLRSFAGSNVSPFLEILSKTVDQSVETPGDLIPPQIRGALMDLLLKRLTPEQLEKWHDLVGDKFQTQ